MSSTQGFLQLVQDDQCNKVFVAVQQNHLCLFPDDPQKTNCAPFQTINLQTARLSDNPQSQRPKSFSLVAQGGVVLEFSCPTNSVRSSWIKSISDCVPPLRAPGAHASFESVPAVGAGNGGLRGLLNASNSNNNNNNNNNQGKTLVHPLMKSNAANAVVPPAMDGHGAPARGPSLVLSLPATPNNIVPASSPFALHSPQYPLMTQQYPPTPFVSESAQSTTLRATSREREAAGGALIKPLTKKAIGPAPAKKAPTQHQAPAAEKELPQWIPGNYGNARYSSRKVSTPPAVPAQSLPRRTLSHTQTSPTSTARPITLRDMPPHTQRDLSPPHTGPHTTAPHNQVEGLTMAQLRNALQSVPSPLRAQLVQQSSRGGRRFDSERESDRERDAEDEDDERLRAAEHDLSPSRARRAAFDHESHTLGAEGEEALYGPHSLSTQPHHTQHNTQYRTQYSAQPHTQPHTQYSTQHTQPHTQEPVRRKGATPTQARRAASSSHNATAERETNRALSTERGRAHDRLSAPQSLRAQSSASAPRSRSQSMQRSGSHKEPPPTAREDRDRERGREREREKGSAALEWSRHKAWDKHVVSAGYFTPAQSSSLANTQRDRERETARAATAAALPVQNASETHPAPHNAASQAAAPPQTQWLSALDHYRQKKQDLRRAPSAAPQGYAAPTRRLSTSPHNTNNRRAASGGGVFEFMQSRNAVAAAAAVAAKGALSAPPYNAQAAPQRETERERPAQGFVFQARPGGPTAPTASAVMQPPQRPLASPQRARPATAQDAQHILTQPSHTQPSHTQHTLTQNAHTQHAHSQAQALLAQRPLSSTRPTHSHTQNPSGITERPLSLPARPRPLRVDTRRAEDEVHEDDPRRCATANTNTANTNSLFTPRAQSVTDVAEWQRLSQWLAQVGVAHTLSLFHRHGVTRLSEVELCDAPRLLAMGLEEDDVCCVLRGVCELSERLRSVMDSHNDEQQQQFQFLQSLRGAARPYGPGEDELSAISHEDDEDNAEREGDAEDELLLSQALSLSRPPERVSLSHTAPLSEQPLCVKREEEQKREREEEEEKEIVLCEVDRLVLRDSLLRAFDAGDLSLFRAAWARFARLRVFSSSSATTTDGNGDAATKLAHVKQAIELHLFVHFYVHAVREPHHAAEKSARVSEAKEALRAYLERAYDSQWRERDREKDRDAQKEREAFTASREFAMYAGLVFVPQPQENAAFGALFTSTLWRDQLRARLAQFVALCLSLAVVDEDKGSSPQKPLNALTEQPSVAAAAQCEGSGTTRSREKEREREECEEKEDSMHVVEDDLRREEEKEREKVDSLRAGRAEDDAAAERETEREGKHALPQDEEKSQRQRQRESSGGDVDACLLAQCLSPQSTSSSISQLTDDTSLRRLSRCNAVSAAHGHNALTPPPTPEHAPHAAPSSAAPTPPPPATTRALASRVFSASHIAQKWASRQQSGVDENGGGAKKSESHGAAAAVSLSVSLSPSRDKASPASLQRQVDQYNRHLRRQRATLLAPQQSLVLSPSPAGAAEPIAAAAAVALKNSPAAVVERVNRYKALLHTKDGKDGRENKEKEREKDSPATPRAALRSDGSAAMVGSTPASVAPPPPPPPSAVSTAVPAGESAQNALDIDAIDAIVARIVSVPQRMEDWDRSEGESDEDEDCEREGEGEGERPTVVSPSPCAATAEEESERVCLWPSVESPSDREGERETESSLPAENDLAGDDVQLSLPLSENNDDEEEDDDELLLGEIDAVLGESSRAAKTSVDVVLGGEGEREGDEEREVGGDALASELDNAQPPRGEREPVDVEEQAVLGPSERDNSVVSDDFSAMEKEKKEKEEVCGEGERETAVVSLELHEGVFVSAAPLTVAEEKEKTDDLRDETLSLSLGRTAERETVDSFSQEQETKQKNKGENGEQGEGETENSPLCIENTVDETLCVESYPENAASEKREQYTAHGENAPTIVALHIEEEEKEKNAADERGAVHDEMGRKTVDAQEVLGPAEPGVVSDDSSGVETKQESEMHSKDEGEAVDELTEQALCGENERETTFSAALPDKDTVENELLPESLSVEDEPRKEGVPESAESEQKEQDQCLEPYENVTMSFSSHGQSAAVPLTSAEEEEKEIPESCAAQDETLSLGRPVERERAVSSELDSDVSAAPVVVSENCLAGEEESETKRESEVHSEGETADALAEQAQLGERETSPLTTEQTNEDEQARSQDETHENAVPAFSEPCVICDDTVQQEEPALSDRDVSPSDVAAHSVAPQGEKKTDSGGSADDEALRCEETETETDRETQTAGVVEEQRTSSSQQDSDKDNVVVADSPAAAVVEACINDSVAIVPAAAESFVEKELVPAQNEPSEVSERESNDAQGSVALLDSVEDQTVEEPPVPAEENTRSTEATQDCKEDEEIKRDESEQPAEEIAAISHIAVESDVRESSVGVTDKAPSSAVKRKKNKKGKK